jgi:DNA-directed RNA polymerase subunit RPC12/RpoP
MSILFKGNLEEGNYTLIKTTDGWVLKGKTSYVGFNFADRPQGEWIDTGKDPDHSHPLTAIWYRCSECGDGTNTKTNFCPNCGARMFAKDTNVPNKEGVDDYERAIEQMEHDMLYEPTYNSEDGSM